MVQQCGLLTRKKESVPLKTISVNLSICEFVAGVSATLNYENEEEVPLEAFFVFPMDEDSAVYSFEALVDGKKIVAELQDKCKAHIDYENAICQGYQAFLLEEDKCSRDVFSCDVGNLPPGSKVELTLRYVQELPLEADGAMRYVLPAILNPRYHLSGLPEDSCLNMKTPVAPLEDPPYTLSLAATITSQHSIEKVQSNCTLNPVEYLGSGKTSAQVSLADGHKFDRDVELLVYYSEVHSPSVALETGMPEKKPDSLMGDPCAMVSFYPDIPEIEVPVACGEFVILMDCSGSMKSPMNKQAKSQPRIEAAKETLILLLKSLSIGCYFNVYEFGSSFETFFPDSVMYTQETMEEAVERVQLMEADRGGTEILTPLRDIYRKPPIAGHPLQLFVFTDGEVADTFTIIREVKLNSKKHRCFSFGIGEGASTSLIKNIARVSGGMAEFITGKDRMQSKVLRALKRSLQPVVEDISLSWDLPSGLSAEMLSPEQTSLFRGQRLIVYAQLSGTMLPEEATGEVCLKYTFQGKSFENKMVFPLQPKFDASLTIHRLAAKSLLQAKDMGFRETVGRDKKDVLNISLESGVISSFTAFVAINKELNKPIQGPLVYRNIPTPVLLTAINNHELLRVGRAEPVYAARPSPRPLVGRCPPQRAVTFCATKVQQHSDSDSRKCEVQSSRPRHRKSRALFEDYTQGKKTFSSTGVDVQKPQAVFEEELYLRLISLQKADGSWDLDESLGKVLDMSLENILAAHPAKHLDPSAWATILAVIWLHANCSSWKWEWELLEKKAIAWVRPYAGSSMSVLVKAAIAFLKVYVNPVIFDL